VTDGDIRAAILQMVIARGQDRSICPSDVARSLGSDWRPLMPRVRQVAAAMPEVMATQRGQAVDPVTARGPIRLRLR
jgi:hypothetical protein